MRSLGANVVLLAALIVATVAVSAPAATDAEIHRAIEKGRDWLVSLGPNGTWPQEDAVLPNGRRCVALCTLALLGEDPDSPLMKAAADAAISSGTELTYIRGFRAMALALLQAKTKDTARRDLLRRALQVDALWLVRAQGKNGGWNYTLESKDARFDFSNTQLAVLALWQAELAGVEVPDFVWQRAQERYYKAQAPDGSWSYTGGNVGYGSMTAAGLASIYIIADMLDLNSGCPCRKGKSTSENAELDRRVDLALKWLGDNFKADQNPIAGGWKFYWLYAVERVGIAAGYKYFGAHNWYKEGAEALVKTQLGDGAWNGDAGSIVSTCFALMFLHKGQAPLLYQKLEIPKGADGKACEWNNHRRDIANLTAYLSTDLEELCRWQITSLLAPMDELHEAPILFITPETAPQFSADDKKKLREFTDTGGTILVEASCGNPNVRRWFIQFTKEVWPEWGIKPLGPDHGTFLDKHPLKKRPEVLGINDGIRTSVFYVMDDISCAWQTKAVTAHEYLFKWGMNLVTYATDRSPLRAKLEILNAGQAERYTQPVKAGPKATLRIARVQHSGNWEVGANYGGLQKLADHVKAKAGITLQVKDNTKPPITKGGTAIADLADSDVAFLTGTGEIALKPEERAGLTAFVAKGGFLWFEATEGSRAFDESLRQLATEMNWTVKILPVSHPLMSGRMDPGIGYNLTQGVEFSQALRISRAGRNHADICGVFANDKLIGVHLPLDVVFSLTGYNAYGCAGYKKKDAEAVATNLLVYLSAKDAPPTPPPAPAAAPAPGATATPAPESSPPAAAPAPSSAPASAKPDAAPSAPPAPASAPKPTPPPAAGPSPASGGGTPPPGAS